ncbi:MAG: sugar O-acetyltransferase [Erysipelothrix sp.]|nr:sugar O-acetyltransferase [Erysipelothrix sp.]
MNEHEKMKNGLWYDANYDPALIKDRLLAEDLCFDYNHVRPSNIGMKTKILKQLLPNAQENITILSPFYTDYGTNCFIGEHTFINHNVYLMDGATITIGKHCFIGPNCGLYTANHPFLIDERNSGLEQALPITLEDNVWLGANVTILPGVTISEGAVIGAGSVVIKDIPPHVVAVGNPCKVIRTITENDSIQYKEIV